MMKFPTPWGVATLVSQTPVVFECRREGWKQAVELPKERKAQDTTSLMDQVLVNPSYPEQLVTIGTCLSPEGLSQLKSLLKKNIDIFAWEPSDMTREGIVRPVKYPTLISNPVLVKKAHGSWRMCIDFKIINAAYPKDYYPPPEIDSKIEAVMGFPLKCFLDAYKGYHQVQMAEEDEEKTTFYTDQAYIDDMVIKSKSEREMLADIAETFDNLRRINMKLNPKSVRLGSRKGNSWATWLPPRIYELT
ncbi:hypothetical protein Tco_1154396 [Tanacetum coccineum]